MVVGVWSVYIKEMRFNERVFIEYIYNSIQSVTCLIPNTKLHKDSNSDAESRIGVISLN